MGDYMLTFAFVTALALVNPSLVAPPKALAVIAL